MGDVPATIAAPADIADNMAAYTESKSPEPDQVETEILQGGIDQADRRFELVDNGLV